MLTYQYQINIISNILLLCPHSEKKKRSAPRGCLSICTSVSASTTGHLTQWEVQRPLKQLNGTAHVPLVSWEFVATVPCCVFCLSPTSVYYKSDVLNLHYCKEFTLPQPIYYSVHKPCAALVPHHSTQSILIPNVTRILRLQNHYLGCNVCLLSLQRLILPNGICRSANAFIHSQWGW